MDKAAFLERMAEAIDARIPKDANRKAWLRRRALDADLSFDTLLGYVAGENEPGVLNFRKLCRIFPGLDVAVFGEENEAGEVAEVMSALAAIIEKHKGRVS